MSTPLQIVPTPRRGDAPPGDPPIACTLGAGETATRIEEWTALLAGDPRRGRGVTRRRGLDGGGLRLELGDDTDVAEVARLAAAERGCCGFFRFAVTIDHRGLALEVRVPADARPVLAGLFGVPD
jgi:hypothetical protein